MTVLCSLSSAEPQWCAASSSFFNGNATLNLSNSCFGGCHCSTFLVRGVSPIFLFFATKIPILFWLCESRPPGGRQFWLWCTDRVSKASVPVPSIDFKISIITLFLSSLLWGFMNATPGHFFFIFFLNFFKILHLCPGFLCHASARCSTFLLGVSVSPLELESETSSGNESVSSPSFAGSPVLASYCLCPGGLPTSFNRSS